MADLDASMRDVLMVLSAKIQVWSNAVAMQQAGIAPPRSISSLADMMRETSIDCAVLAGDTEERATARFDEARKKYEAMARRARGISTS